MNQASELFGLGFQVYQQDWQWYVDYQGEIIPFYDSKVILERINNEQAGN